MQLINTDDYTIPGLIWNGIGCFFWLLTYIFLLKNSIKKKFVEMPFLIATGNISWEFVWSFIVHPNTGQLYVWAYQGSFILDVFIFTLVFIYGSKQVDIPWLKKNFRVVLVGILLMWIPLNYFFVIQGYDDAIGATSGYILNLIISFLYPILYLKSNPENFSKEVGVFKFLGTGFISISMFIIFPKNYFLLTLCIFCAIADFIYIFILNQRKNGFGIS